MTLPRLLLLCACAVPLSAATYVVTSTSGSAAVAGSLPWAVQQANIRPGLDYVHFSLPGSGLQAIQLDATLNLNDQVVVNGATQPGYGSTPLVYVLGMASMPGLFRLQQGSAGSTIQALGLFQFTGCAIAVANPSTGNWIQDNWIGFLGSGNAVQRNSDLFADTCGVQLRSNDNIVRFNTISGVDDGIIVGNTGSGSSFDEFFRNNRIHYNRIGTDPAGESAGSHGNRGTGVLLSRGAQDTLLGPSNVISGNAQGIIMRGPTVTGNVAFYNRIGTNTTGLTAVPNTRWGVVLADGANYNAVGGPFGGNVIAGNGLGGVSVGSAADGPAVGNWVQYNRIGISAADTALGSAQPVGVSINTESSYTVVAINAIAGNAQHGVLVTSCERNYVGQNWIGRGPAGGLVANGGFGVYLDGASLNFVVENAYGQNSLGNVGQRNTGYNEIRTDPSRACESGTAECVAPDQAHIRQLPGTGR